MSIAWLTEHIIEIFGAVTGIAYVILEIRRNILLWPLGIITSAIYIYVFGTNGFYANMGLQGYYLVISFYGWYMWRRQVHPAAAGAAGSDFTVAGSGTNVAAAGIADSAAAGAGRSAGTSLSGAAGDQAVHTGHAADHQGKADHAVTDIRLIERSVAAWCLAAALLLWLLLWLLLGRGAGSPVAVWDGLIASLSVVATWMLTRKYFELWYVWIVANGIALVVYLAAGLYPTAILFLVYFGMAIAGLTRWRSELRAAGRGGGVNAAATG